MENSGGSWCWTNERHVDFLNSMEASFVRTMYENNDRLLPLDRYLPDSSESTLDLTKERGRRFSTSDIMDPKIRTDKKIRRPLSQSDISSQDQVVAQLENKKDDKKGRDRRGVPVTQTTPSN